MLSSRVELHDIKDAEAFVVGTIRRKVRMIGPMDWEDMVAEGLMILVDLARLYDPERDRAKKAQAGHVCKGPTCCKPSFAGYANFLLPKKIIEAYYRNKPECMLRTKSDGTRSYVILESAVSVDERNDKNNGHNSEDHYSVVDYATTRHPGNFIAVPEVKR